MGALLEAVRQKTYYEILHLERDATSEQIKEAYKEVAKLYHPDSNFYTEIIQDPLSEEETEVFKFITQAYTTLLNTEKRSQYDKTLAPMLKGWDTEEKKEDLGNKKVSVVMNSPGSIDLGKFQHVIKAKATSTGLHKRAKDENKKVKLLVGILAFAGMCTGAAVILVLR